MVPAIYSTSVLGRQRSAPMVPAIYSTSVLRRQRSAPMVPAIYSTSILRRQRSAPMVPAIYARHRGTCYSRRVCHWLPQLHTHTTMIAYKQDCSAPTARFRHPRVRSYCACTRKHDSHFGRLKFYTAIMVGLGLVSCPHPWTPIALYGVPFLQNGPPSPDLSTHHPTYPPTHHPTHPLPTIPLYQIGFITLHYCILALFSLRHISRTTNNKFHTKQSCFAITWPVYFS